MSETTLNIAIIGAGSRGIQCFGKHFDEREDATVKAICDPNRVRLKIMAEKFRNKPSIYTSVDEMLNSEKLDACVITSPDYCHAPNAVKVLEKGINVLIDKPLATTVEGCDNILEAAEKSGKTVMIGFNLRHDPTLKRLKQIIKDGILGKVFMIENREFYDGGRTYMSRWNRKYKYSGGLWIHKGSHDFDVFNWLLDFPKPVKVSSTAGINVFNEKNIPFELKKGIPVGPTCTECPYKSTCPDRYEIEEFEEWGNEAREEDNYSKDLCMYTSDKDTHDNGIAIVEYADGSRASHLECFVSSFSDRRYTVVGDRGIAEVSLHGRKIKVKARWTGEEIIYNIPEVQGGHGGADPGLVENFVNVISKGLSNTSTAEHGRTSTAIGQAAELSRRENRTVQLKELI